MNKKAQHFDSTGDPGAKFGNASPILVLGILIFILPMIDTIIGMNIPNWIGGVGLVIMLIGAGHSMMNMNN